MKTGDTVTDRNGNLGKIYMSDDETVCIKWSNGETGSFLRKYLAANGISMMTWARLG